jgi:hypothetical protein
MKTILLDRDVLQNLYGDCPESLVEIFSEFLANYPEVKQNLFSTFNSGNLSSLKRVLHFHGPSFMYLGMPQVADMFKGLELKCSGIDNHFSLSNDFKELMQAVEAGWLQATNEMKNYKKAV